MPTIVRTLISLGLLALVIVFADVQAVWQALLEVDLYWVGVVLFIAVCDRVMTNYRWQVLLVGRGVAVKFMRLFRVQLAANFLGSFLPGFIGVDAVRITALCRSGESTAPVIAATLVDRATLAIATLMVGAITVFTLAQTRVPGHIVQFVLVMAAIGVAGLGVCLHPSVRRWFRLNLLPRVPERLRHTVADVVDASLAYRHEGRTVMRVIVATAVLFALRILFAKAVAYSCGVDIAFMDLLLVIPILWIVVMLPITIGGIGVQDAGYVVLMALVGVGAPVAVSMSLVEHIVARVASLPGAFFLSEFSRKSPEPLANSAKAPSA